MTNKKIVKKIAKKAVVATGIVMFYTIMVMILFGVFSFVILNVAREGKEAKIESSTKEFAEESLIINYLRSPVTPEADGREMKMFELLSFIDINDASSTVGGTDYKLVFESETRKIMEGFFGKNCWSVEIENPDIEIEKGGSCEKRSSRRTFETEIPLSYRDEIKTATVKIIG